MMKQIVIGAAMLLSLTVAGAPAMADGEKELGPDAVLLTGDDLAAALTNVKAEGWAFDGSDWFYFTEHYMPDGSIVGVGGPAEGSSKWQWSANWRTEAEQACFDYPDLGSGACRAIYLENGVYKNVDGGDVRAHWQPMQ